MQSTVFILDEEQNIKKSYRYDAFGGIIEESGSLENRITYTGQMYDGVTGQYYLRARFYNPAIGRSTQEDTYRGDGLNLYAYCRNNPVMYYDPSGFELCPHGKTNPQAEQTEGTGGLTVWRGTEVGKDGRTYIVDVGAFGEHIAQDLLVENGWSDFTYIKNASDNGIDIIARGPDGQLGFFEVKTSTTGDIQNLSVRQSDMDYFVRAILSDAAKGNGRYGNIDPSLSQTASDIFNEYKSNPSNVTGTVIGVDVKEGQIYISRWGRE